MTAPFRCAADSLARQDELAGSASTVRAFLLIECAGPWGTDALRDCAIPDAVSGELAVRARKHKVRPLLIRRHGRSAASAMTVFVGRSDAGKAWLETTQLEDPAELLDIDLAALGAGRSCGLTPYDGPLFCVCTHGKHDVCCAERGRPVAAALHRHFPEATWEVSHIGGDRFAGNVLVLPDGLYYGRITADEAAGFAEDHQRGLLALDHLRGRSSYSFAVQAAEIYLRRHLDRPDFGALTFTGRSVTDDLTAATFAVDGVPWVVQLRTGKTPPARLTCQAPGDGTALRHELVSITQG